MAELTAPITELTKPKRRIIMESQVCGSGAEVRRIHIIYFLSRKGHIEHPHLIRVHHHSRNGVHLRDVKRWLSELRGKEMPDAFSWAYKRRYKKGYVWQDLLDEDLITPISDNEYVLKGSEISFSSRREDSVSQEQSPTTKEGISEKKEEEEEGIQEIKLDKSRKSTSPEIDRESFSFGSEKSTLTAEDSSFTKLDDQEDNQDHHHSSDRFKVKMLCEEKDDSKIEEEDHSMSTTSISSSFTKRNNINIEEKECKQPLPAATDSVSSSTFKRSKSYSNGASVLFRNLISCGTADTNDSAMVTINKRNKLSSLSKPIHHIGNDQIMMSKADKFGGSDHQNNNVFGIGTSLNRQPPYTSSCGRKSFDGGRIPSKGKTEFNNQREIPPYKPINGPQCSQCGKPFKPEKLHTHMKSCKGMKASKYTRPAIPSAATSHDKEGSERSSEFSFDNNSPSCYYLMHGQ